MHGRVKVRTSEEEKARKEKERQEKLKLFKHAMQKIFTKRKDGLFDKELLDITSQVLISNPDIYTLWNIRRETINVLRKSCENEEELTKLYDSELYLTEMCLKINPKSYCAWHHREWVLTTRNDPDWKKELMLCDKYLKLDERNFHTWDYRRFIVTHFKPPLEEEFNFTTEKLYDNFSNYSAWHYRSKLLVELHPDKKEGRPIEDGHHKNELKMVQSAAFTDPDDTSAWFYQRWLLGAVKESTQLVACSLSASLTTIAFNKFVDKDYVSTRVKLSIDGCYVDGHWIPCTGNIHDNVWILNENPIITNNSNVLVEFQKDDCQQQYLTCHRVKECLYIGKADISFQRKYSAAVVEELKTQLDSCRQLLELEPDNRWTLLTTTVFLHCIDAKQYFNELIQNLKMLIKLDPLRAGYYRDLLTKWSLENQITKEYANGEDTSFSIKFEHKISNLPHLQYYAFCDIVDLSNQNLSSNALPAFVVLQHCKVLSLKNNKLTSLRGFPDLNLAELHLEGNSELNTDEINVFKQKVNFKVYS